MTKYLTASFVAFLVSSVGLSAKILNSRYDHVCLSAETVSVDCQTIQSDNPKKPYGQLVVLGSTRKVDYQFYARRPYEDLGFCRDIANEIRNIATKEKVICIHGSLSSKETGNNKKSSFSSLLDRVENHSKCWSYFIGECNK